MELFKTGYAALFLIISLGIIFGRLKIKGFSFGVSAVIFAALLLGHYGFSVPSEFMRFGLLLFIFTIGIQAGPGFFEAFMKSGRQLILTVAIIASAALLTVFFAKLLHIEMPLAIGLFTGALTSTPGLAAAADSTTSPLAPIGYGISYTFGVIGVVLFVNILPAIFRVKLKDEEDNFLEELKKENPSLTEQNLLINNPNIDGKTIKEIAISSMTGCLISRILQNGLGVVPTEETTLRKGDLVKVVGTVENVEKASLLLGDLTDKRIPLSGSYENQWLLVTNKEIVNKRYSDVALPGYYNATVLKIKRSGIELTPKPYSKFMFGDRLSIAADKENMKKVVRLLGNDDKKLSATDFLPITLGIVLGILAGKISIPLGNFSFNPGITGGTLAVALILSRLGKTGPIIWSMSGSANNLLRELGLMLFLAVIGTQAGSQLVETIHQYGFKLILVGAVITIVPIFVGALVGRLVFKLNFLMLLGVITGGMTSTPGLAVADSKSETNAAPVAYATVYPFALVLVIIVTQILSKI